MPRQQPHFDATAGEGNRSAALIAAALRLAEQAIHAQLLPNTRHYLPPTPHYLPRREQSCHRFSPG